MEKSFDDFWKAELEETCEAHNISFIEAKTIREHDEKVARIAWTAAIVCVHSSILNLIPNKNA